MKKILVITTLLMIVAVSSYYYVWYGGARNVSTEESSFNVTSKSISNEFDSDIEKSNKKYLEKVIAIKGIVSKISGTQAILENTIVCELKELDTSIKKDQTITLKGRVVGYDDLMAEIKLDQCSVINND